MQIIEKRLDEIHPYENNPRKNDAAVKYVAASIREFGFKVPIVIDAGGEIVAGHTRYKAAQELGLETVPCVVADDLTPQQIKAFRLADNKTAEMAGWDFEALEFELEGVGDLDMGVFGFDVEDMDFMDFDGSGDGGGSRMQTGDKVRVVIGATMFDIEDKSHELYDLTRNIDHDVAADFVKKALLEGKI